MSVRQRLAVDESSCANSPVASGFEDHVVRRELGAACETGGVDRLMSSVTVLKTLSGIALSGTRSMTTTQSARAPAVMRPCAAAP